MRVRTPTTAELDMALRLRREVFCTEQGVSVEEELDGRDPEADHLVAVAGERVVGTCRLIADGPTWRLQRMAVARDWRGRGVGAALLGAAHAHAAAAGAERMRLSAQVAVRDFYERAGYVAEGATYLEAGILHVAMERPLADAER